MTQVFKYIDTTADLVEVVSECRQHAILAIDTEFARFNTYFPIVGLIQLATDDDCYLVDPLAIDDLRPLADLLMDQEIVKVLHAGSEDMEVFQHALGMVPTPVFDTQISSGILGVGFSLSYQKLVDHYLDIDIPKDQTRSDWLARPLTDEQLKYAALDVIHLIEVYRKQQEELASSEKHHWIQSECARLGQEIPTAIDPDEAFKRVKGLWQLDARQLSLVMILSAWRETTARSENVPRNRVLDEKTMMAIAREQITKKSELQEAGASHKQIRKYGEDIELLIQEAKLVPDAELPEPMIRRDAPINNKKLKQLRQVVEQKANELMIAPEILTTRKWLEKLLRSHNEFGHYRLPNELKGWRETVIGEPLLQALEQGAG